MQQTLLFFYSPLILSSKFLAATCSANLFDLEVPSPLSPEVTRTETLKIAFEKDSNLKAKAKRDREFIRFFENADFLAIF